MSSGNPVGSASLDMAIEPFDHNDVNGACYNQTRVAREQMFGDMPYAEIGLEMMRLNLPMPPMYIDWCVKQLNTNLDLTLVHKTKILIALAYAINSIKDSAHNAKLSAYYNIPPEYLPMYAVTISTSVKDRGSN